MRSRTNVLFPFLSFIAIVLCCTSCRYGEPEADPVSGLTQIICTGTTPDSTIYYVAPDGSDQSDGLSETTAFRTLAKGFQAVKPGGTLRILPGTWHEGIAIKDCGSELYPILVEGYTGRPVINGKNQWSSGIFCENCTNYRFRNLEFQDFTDMGIACTQSRKIALESLRIRNCGRKVQQKAFGYKGHGLYIARSENVEIIDCEVFRNGPTPQVFPDYLLGSAIHILDNQEILIRQNRCFKNIGGGIHIENSFEVVAEDNECYENDLDASVANGWEGGLWLDGGGIITIRNNLFRDNLGPGLQVSDQNGQSPTGIRLENNISTGNYFGIYLWNFGTVDWPDSSQIFREGNQWTGNEREDILIRAGT